MSEDVFEHRSVTATARQGLWVLKLRPADPACGCGQCVDQPERVEVDGPFEEDMEALRKAADASRHGRAFVFRATEVTLDTRAL